MLQLELSKVELLQVELFQSKGTAEAFSKMQIRKKTLETNAGNLFVKVKFEKGSDASTSRFVKEKIRETDAE